ncbi:MAG: hypothetical protein H7Y43_06635, partial [Akkermansiaceae bacterium]|nr:hypothetical protein [Verrucomicrobiales bacterium]
MSPTRGELFALNAAAFRGAVALTQAAEPGLAKTAGTQIDLPMPDGKTARFNIVEASIMEPELAAKFPEIRTYAGVGIDDPAATVRLDISPSGFHAQVLSPSGAIYVDPAYEGDAALHVSYFKRDYRKAAAEFQCLTAGRGGESILGKSLSGSTPGARPVSGATLRRYRLAVAATGEYTQRFGGTVAGGMAAIVSAINRVNGVYETELAVRLILVANNNLLVYTNSGTDPYSNNNPNSLLSQNQSNLDIRIGPANYDLGHVFSTAGGGLASRGVVCVNGFKAQGETGMPNPVGDAFYIDYVAHELGHQFGADHSFNSQTGSCNGNRTGSVAYEPGSGSTIMAYAGICAPNDLQEQSDPYFHAGSVNEIQSYLTSGGGSSCAVSIATSNQPPIVSAGLSYTIPASTPFALTAIGSDPDGDALTYCWEQMDLGAATSLSDPDNGSSPLFRSFSPTNSPTRFFPRLSSVLAHTNWNQEILPTLSRTLHFRVTARDNRTGGGGVADADTAVTVVGGLGPFAVTSPNTAVSWSGFNTVTWDVAGTQAPPINTGGVNIFLSTNGGNTFSFLLGTNVPNTGAALVAMPNLNTTQARIKVQGSGNIFYDISDANFTITPGVGGPLVQFAGTILTVESCTPANGAIDPYETVTVSWSLWNVGSVATTNLAVTLLATNGVFDPGGAQSYGAIAPGAVVTRSFSFVPAGVAGGSVTGVVQLADGAADMGVFAQIFPLGVEVSLITTQSFSNAGFIS